MLRFSVRLLRKLHIMYEDYDAPLLKQRGSNLSVTSAPRISSISVRSVPIEVLEYDEEVERLSMPKAPEPDSIFTEYYKWAINWTEDGIGMALALVLFAFTTTLASLDKNINDDYAQTSQWAFGAVMVGIFLIFSAHTVLGKPLFWESYSIILLIAVVARSIGNYEVLTNSGLSASLWAILIGIFLRTSGFVLTNPVFNGEFFVKVGVTLMAMDFTSVVKIGLPGLMIAWGDTLIVLALGIFISMKVVGYELKDSIVISGATNICGSSAATAISTSIHEKGYKDEVAKTIIAIMGVFNAPLMPIMPLARTVGHLNPAVVGAWIGGSIDSTGQVTASAQMGGDIVLKTAIIVKMAQNILIGPLCLAFTAYFQKSFQPSILVNRFPLFVIGFLLTSAIATSILQSDSSGAGLKDNVIPNAWCISEYITLIGFAAIGLDIDLITFFTSGNKHTKILMAYLMIQSIDIASTFGWSYLMFHNRDISDDDGEQNDP